MQNWKSYAEISCVIIPAKNEKFLRQKKISSFLFQSSFIWLQESCDAFFSVVALTGRPLPLQHSVDPVSLIFLIKLWTAMREHSKLGCSFQILYALQPFSLKSFSMTAFCLSVKTILLRSSELGNCETSERRPVTSTDFDLHCNGFLHCHDFFTRQRRKKTN